MHAAMQPHRNQRVMPWLSSRPGSGWCYSTCIRTAQSSCAHDALCAHLLQAGVAFRGVGLGHNLKDAGPLLARDKHALGHTVIRDACRAGVQVEQAGELAGVTCYLS